MYVNPKDKTVRAAQEKRKAIHDANAAARKQANVQAMNKVAKAGKS